MRKRLNPEKKSCMAGNNSDLTAPCPPKSQSQEAGPAPQLFFLHLFLPFHLADPIVSWNRELNTQKESFTFWWSELCAQSALSCQHWQEGDRGDGVMCPHLTAGPNCITRNTIPNPKTAAKC